MGQAVTRERTKTKAASHAQRDALWQRLEAFSPHDESAAFPFVHRLARENGWSRPYAFRVLEEYKRFLYLMLRAGHPVTPSDEVDQAWHLHLLYTRSYWEDLCRDIAGRPLHHGPTRGGEAEGAKFHDWYERTKDSYERLFGEPPPGDIWPSSEKRFGDVQSFERVNRARHWVLPKPRGWGRVPVVTRSVLPLALVSNGTLMLIGILGTLAVLWLIGAAWQARAVQRRTERIAEIKETLKTEPPARQRHELKQELARLVKKQRQAARGSSGSGGWFGCGGCGGCSGCGGCGGCGG